MCSDDEREPHDHWVQRQTDQGTHTYCLYSTGTNYNGLTFFSQLFDLEAVNVQEANWNVQQVSTTEILNDKISNV